MNESLRRDILLQLNYDMSLKGTVLMKRIALYRINTKRVEAMRQVSLADELKALRHEGLVERSYVTDSIDRYTGVLPELNWLYMLTVAGLEAQIVYLADQMHEIVSGGNRKQNPA